MTCWQRLDRGQLNLVVDVRWLRRWVDATLGQVPAGEATLETIAPLLQRTRVAGLGFDLNQKLTLDLHATVGSEEDLKSVSETTQALLTLGKNALTGLRRQAGSGPKGMSEAQEWVIGLLADLIGEAQLETAGKTVRVHSAIPFDAAEAAQALDAFTQQAGVARKRAQSVNNLKQIGLAFHNYVSQKNEFIKPVMYGGKTGKVPYSWRVALLPYLEAQELYKAYNFDEPWDGPNNRKLIDKMPVVYGYPEAGRVSSSKTAYLVFTGPKTLLGNGEKVNFVDVTDGLSNTLLAVEARRDIPWTKPEDIPFDPNGPLPEPGGFVADGFNALFADGSVRFIRKTVKPQVLKALITRAGGEVISSDSY